MIEIQEMSDDEIEELLGRADYGHFACARNNQPYVVPIHYAYGKPNIYIYTTDGKKSEIIKANPRVCLQVEEVIDAGNWRSVIVTGDAEQIDDKDDRDTALSLILAKNPALTPAISVRWMDNWVRENIEVIYRIVPQMITGRSAVRIATRAALSHQQRPQLY